MVSNYTELILEEIFLFMTLIMTRQLFAAFCAIWITTLVCPAVGKCVMYDVCVSGSKSKNCKYEGDAQEMEDKDFALEICPSLKEHKVNGSLRLCCSRQQLEITKREFINLGLVGRCPACLNNLKRTFCDLACHPGKFTMHPRIL